LAFPDMASTVNYSGVAAFTDHLELQGETGIVTPDLAKLLQIVVKDVPAYLQKPFTAKGILTLTDNDAAYRNLKVGFAGFDGTGHIVAKNFHKDAKGPLHAEIALEST